MNRPAIVTLHHRVRAYGRYPSGLPNLVLRIGLRQNSYLMASCKSAGLAMSEYGFRTKSARRPVFTCNL